MSQPWPMVLVGQVLTPISRPETVVPERTYGVLGAHWYAKGLYTKQTLTGAAIRAPKVYRVEEGDFVYNRLFAWMGSFALASKENHECYVSNEFPCFRVRSEILDGRYLWWYFSRQSAWNQALGFSKGGTPTSRNRLKEEAFLAMEMALPPLEEQRRLVAKIDALAGKIEEAKRLSHEGGEEGDALMNAAAAKMISDVQPVRPFRIEEIAEVRGGIQKSPLRTPGDNPVRYLTVAHVHRNRIDLGNPRHFEVGSEELGRWCLKAGDVLIIEGNGSADQIGRTALFRGEIEPCVHQNHVIRIRPDQQRIDPEFLNLYMNSPIGQEEVQSRSRTTSGLRGLSVGRIKEITVPVPRLDEQRHIVQHMHSVQAKLDELKRQQAATSAHLDGLLPAILDRAFNGEL